MRLEPINPSAWLWLYEVVGGRKAAIVDTYWQTETGGHVIAPIPGAVPTKPGSATLPFFGVRPIIVDNDGSIIEGPGEGNLCFAAPWPGISRSILGDHERFEKTYYKPFPGYYFTGIIISLFDCHYL
jgi:acetyl-CoA synthetase